MSQGEGVLPLDSVGIRIVNAAIGAAADGGFDTVVMREVADRADVAVGTVYNRFPSKVHLLVGALDAELLLFRTEVGAELHSLEGAGARLRFLVDRLAFGMQRSHHVAEALTRAYTAAWAMAIPEADVIRARTIAMFEWALADTEGRVPDRRCAEVLTDVWTSEIFAVAQRRCSTAEMRARLMVVIGLLAGEC